MLPKHSAEIRLNSLAGCVELHSIYTICRHRCIRIFLGQRTLFDTHIKCKRVRDFEHRTKYEAESREHSSPFILAVQLCQKLYPTHALPEDVCIIRIQGLNTHILYTLQPFDSASIVRRNEKLPLLLPSFCFRSHSNVNVFSVRPRLTQVVETLGV